MLFWPTGKSEPIDSREKSAGRRWAREIDKPKGRCGAPFAGPRGGGGGRFAFALRMGVRAWMPQGATVAIGGGLCPVRCWADSASLGLSACECESVRAAPGGGCHDREFPALGGRHGGP